MRKKQMEYDVRVMATEMIPETSEECLRPDSHPHLRVLEAALIEIVEALLRGMTG